MQQVKRMIVRILVSAAPLLAVTASPVVGAESPSEPQLEGLMETAAQAPVSPDHDYVINSLHSILRQAQELKLSQQQTEKIKTITDQYERTRHDRETAYKQREMEVLKLLHDTRSSMFSIENAVQKADQEHSRLRMAGIKAFREARDVLRPEQYSNWRQSHAAQQMAQNTFHQGERGEQSNSEPGDIGRLAPH
jgi:primosomal protein N'